MNRTELQQLSAERIADAAALLAAQQWSGAFYLSGYALECALKSCVLVYIEQTGAIFSDRKYAQNCWTHNIGDLMKHAGLQTDLDKAMGANINLGQNWNDAEVWTEASRYRMFTQSEAERLFNALTDTTDGVLPWLSTYW